MNEKNIKVIFQIENLEEDLLLKQRELEWIINRLDYLKNKLVK